MPHFLPEDSWKEKSVEKARLALIERLRVEKSKEVDRILRQFAQEDRTIPDYLRK